MNTVLIKPHFTEKSLKATSNSGFTFQVDQFATKSQIKEVIEATFAVKVVRISTRLSHVPGKRSATRRSTSRDSLAKYATAYLKKGQTISLFEFNEQGSK